MNFLQSAFAETMAKIDGLRPHALTCCLWALAALKPNTNSTILTALVHESKSKMDEFTPHEMVVSMWACVALGGWDRCMGN